MNGPFETLAFHLLRTTLVTSLAVLVVMGLLRALRIRSPRLHRVAWLLVLVQGWLLVPFTWQVEVATSPAAIATASTPFEATDGIAPQVSIVSAPKAIPPEPFDPVAFLPATGLGLWLIGMGCFIAIGSWRYARIFTAGKPGELATDEAWLEEWSQVRESTALRTPVELRITRGLGPLVCWVPWVFLVLVPRTLWASLTRADRLAILRHELAHCERGDLWKNLAVRVLAIPQWFNPLVWRAVRRFEEAGEWACDDRVAATAGSMDYAKTLLQIADQIAPLPSGAIGMASGVLTRRVERLLHYPNKEVREMRGILLPVLLVVVGLLQVVRIERVAAEETTSSAEVMEVQKEKGPTTRAEKMPAYVIEPPDVITVDIAEVVHKSPRTIQPYDQLVYRYTDQEVNAAPGSRIVNGKQFTTTISERGELSAGSSSQFRATGMRIEDAETILRAFYKVENPGTTMDIDLDFAPGAPQITDKHLLGPDGKVNFGYRYGAVNVNGLTIEQAKQRIEDHLSYYLVDPKVTVDVHTYNSKKFYIISRTGRGNPNVVTCPSTGKDTVMDAIAAVDGLEGVAKVWVERGHRKDHLVKPVDYEAISTGEDTSTNHQLLPNDRLFIEYAESETQHSAPKRFPIGASVNSNAGIAGDMLLAEKERDQHATATRAAYSETGVREALPEHSKPVRYEIGLVIDPKKTLRDLQIEKRGPLLVGESSLLLGTLRVLQKNELVSLFEGQHTVNSGRTDASNMYMHTKAPRVLGNVPDDETVESVETTLEVVERLVRREGNVAFEVRAKLSQDSNTRQTDAAVILNEGQSCLVQISVQRGAHDAGDAYLLITRLAEE
ncbi:M56 family metallopeptidase [Aeoliella sp. SH292]|uniref:M56 family metallopeptidase n=1 Tax=Aeoliella sp. SH292 TaxID=3454464 RepID=UPI003F9A4B5D